MIEFWLGIGMGAGLGNSLDIGAMAGGVWSDVGPPRQILVEIIGVIFPVNKANQDSGERFPVENPGENPG